MAMDWQNYVIFFAVWIALVQCQLTPLDDYVAREDGTYSWELVGTHPGEGYTSYVVNITSHKWKDETVTNQPEWWHYLIIAIPENVEFNNHVFFMITNGNMDDAVPVPERDGRINSTAEYAVGMGCVAAQLKMIPNQYLHCAGDAPDRWRREDDLIAWTWRRYVDDPSDPDILLRLPMVKAVVRSMNAMSEFVPTVAGSSVVPSRFLLAGGSKRGWTAYLGGAVDSRVFAIAPSVLTCLNFVENVHHQYRSLGGWSFAQIDYYAENLTQNIDHPHVQRLMDIVDPYAYINRLTMPKMITSGAGDEHFLPDDTHYFWDDLLGPKYYWMMENSGHSLCCRSNRTTNYVTFFRATALNIPLPQLSWIRNETETSGTITVTTDTTPDYIGAVWGQTLQGERRDFRRHIMGANTTDIVPQDIVWTEEAVMELSPGVYRAEFSKPESGWVAFWIKMEFMIPNAGLFYTTTEVNIIPDTMPFPKCQGSGCHGPLV